jgi:hypothetical protein
MRTRLLLFLSTLLVYAYFFQGYGSNQGAHFDTARAIVERGTFRIDQYWLQDMFGPGFTGDVSFNDQKEVYSAKPPGLPLVVAPFYAAVYHIERALGIDFSTKRVATINLHLCTIWGSGLAGAILAVAMYGYLRSRGMTEPQSILLSAGFAFGSLVFAYSGMLVAQPLLAMCLFVAWRLIDGEGKLTAARATSAGVLLGIAALAEISCAPAIPAYLIAAWLRRRSAVLYLLPGLLAAAAVQMTYQHFAFGSPFNSSYTRVYPVFMQQGQILGHIGWPDPRRLYWLSIHPVRGLLYCCPIFFIAIIALWSPRDRSPGAPRRTSWIVPAAVIGVYLAFNFTYNAWTAGWGTGPRYLVPALPFMLAVAVQGYRRYPRIATALIAISVANMFAVAAVGTQWGIKDIFGKPRGDDPVAESFLTLTKRIVAHDPGGTNLGLRVGIKSLWTLIPPGIVVASVFAWAAALKLRERRIQTSETDVGVTPSAEAVG